MACQQKNSEGGAVFGFWADEGCWVELGVGLDGAGWVSLAKAQQKVDAEG